MAKRNIIVAVSVGVSIITAVMGFVAYKAITGQTTEDVVRVSDARREAKQLVTLCDNVEGVKISLAESTAKFEVYIASDPKQGRQVLANTVMPVIDSRELACNQAQHDISEVKRSLTKADPFVDDAAPRTGRHIGRHETGSPAHCAHLPATRSPAVRRYPGGIREGVTAGERFDAQR